MKIKVIVSGNLRAILDIKSAEITFEIAKPSSIENLMRKIHINPLLVVTAIVNGEVKTKDFVITEDVEIVLFGPMAGG